MEIEMKLGSYANAKDAVLNDLDLYFYLYRGEKFWNMEIKPDYVRMAQLDQSQIIEILEEYCETAGYVINRRSVDEKGHLNFEIGEVTFTTLLQRMIG